MILFKHCSSTFILCFVRMVKERVVLQYYVLLTTQSVTCGFLSHAIGTFASLIG